MTNGAQARCYTRADTDQQFVLVRGQGLAGGVTRFHDLHRSQCRAVEQAEKSARPWSPSPRLVPAGMGPCLARGQLRGYPRRPQRFSRSERIRDGEYNHTGGRGLGEPSELPIPSYPLFPSVLFGEAVPLRPYSVPHSRRRGQETSCWPADSSDTAFGPRVVHRGPCEVEH